MSCLISCHEINKYYGSKHALKNVNFELESGTTTALVGPNGAGKTTLFSLLCNYHLPNTGRIEIMGHQPGSHQLFGQLGALPQDAQLDPRFAIKHQLGLYAKLQGFDKKQAQQECQRVLELVELTDIAGERPAALSHGMRKRVTIAQALIGQPKLVMLDEPTAGLDPTNARNIRQLVMNLSGEVSFIISSHNLDELERLCDNVLLLEQGNLTQQSVRHHDTEQQQSITLLLDNIQQDTYNKLQSMTGVIAAEQLNKAEFILRYDPKMTPNFDIELIQQLRQQQLNYRQLTKGLSLEQQLFS
ncbi:ABC transporter ATP-binding protein [Psychrobium sp. 1_MG-2023]|uniref:ABC transporter ATP-binding protein n=1 Tax=Psychrobium sp. 1_MG-2023 TaxID=3062624 RepID=UPI000C331D83|nr:ABC transporter ATP-binding protein [Psychrobium sp. 1_MG-2023]MDP2561072.1 ABC transporter ATP-binding protein [Psychrobium sp. 1_MG-2023]PKF58362.1 ABC transporter ATP-binding protein [Alteromonadales bacterium alter-6D02]